jgi:YHS domain-containing protein
MSTIKLDPATFPTEVDEFNRKDPVTKEYIPKTVSAPIFERDGKIYCYSENCNEFSEGAQLFSDYYGEFRGGYAWVSEKLEKWAKEHIDPNAYWEWENAGLLCLAV